MTDSDTPGDPRGRVRLAQVIHELRLWAEERWVPSYTAARLRSLADELADLLADRLARSPEQPICQSCGCQQERHVNPNSGQCCECGACTAWVPADRRARSREQEKG